MPNLNQVNLMGNLTRDPELRVTPKGTAICSFSLAINRKWRDGDQTREEVLFIDCEAWQKAGEAISKYVSKGDPLFVSGRLKQDVWEDKETKAKRSKIKVVVDQFQFLGGKAKDGGEPERQPERTPSRPAPQPAPTRENLDEDAPF